MFSYEYFRLLQYLSYLKSGDYILDFGCGAGRGTKYFLEKGYKVDTRDGSIKMIEIASELTGIPVKQMLFEELDVINSYSGIRTCSSILHCNKEDLVDVLHKMSNALVDNGIIYTSFKYSNFSGYRNVRYFTDFTEETFIEFIKAIPSLSTVYYWISSDIRSGRDNKKWLTLIPRFNHL